MEFFDLSFNLIRSCSYIQKKKLHQDIGSSWSLNLSEIMPRVSFFARKNRKHFGDVGPIFWQPLYTIYKSKKNRKHFRDVDDKISWATTYSRVPNKIEGNLIMFRMFFPPTCFFSGLLVYLIFSCCPILLFGTLE